MAQPEQYIIHFTDPSKSSFIVSPYTANGRTFPISGQLDSSAVSADTSLLIYGRGSANYGERIAENVLHLLENFSGATVPVLPISGQVWFSRREYWQTTLTTSGWYRWNDSTSSWDSLTVTYAKGTDPGAVADGIYWFDTLNLTLKRRVLITDHPLTNTWVTVLHSGSNGSTDPITLNATPEKSLKVYNGEAWVSVTSSTFASTTAPTSPVDGDLWYDTANTDLKVWNGSMWASSGGNYVLQTGDTMTGDLTMTGANINIDATKGLIGNVAGSPLADGATLILSSDGFTWEMQSGNSLFSSFVVKNSVGVTVLTVGVSDADDTSTFAGNIQIQSNNEVLGLPALPSGDTAAASKKYVDDVVAIVSGGTPASIDDLLDVYVPTPSHDEFLYYDNVGSPAGQWKNRNILIADVAGAAPLASPSLTGTPIAPTATPATNTTTQIATCSFVHQAIATYALGGADGVLISAAWDSSIYQLDLQTSDGGSPLPVPIQVDLSHTHPSTDVTHTVVDSVLRDALVPGGSPQQLDTTIDVIVEQLSSEIGSKTSRELGNQIILQQIHRPVAPQTEFLIDNDEEYISGFNRLQVFINGIKQYADQRARQTIYFRREFNVSPTAATGLPDDATAYSFTVAVDGQATGSPQTPQTVNVTGSQVQTVQDIIDQINAQVTGATAIYDPRWVGIFVFSDTSGNGSAISITDVDLFTAMGAVGATVSLPIYDYNNIFPDYPGDITQVTNDGAYYEADLVGSPSISYIQASAGIIAYAIVFRTAVPSGAVVEFLIT